MHKKQTTHSIFCSLYEKHGKSEDHFHIALEKKLRESVTELLHSIDTPNRLNFFLKFVDAVYAESMRASKWRSMLAQKSKEIGAKERDILSTLKLLHNSMDALRLRLTEIASEFEEDRELEEYYLRLLHTYETTGKTPH